MPTSALDPATEAALVKSLLAARSDAGRVVDQGTVAELAPRSVELAAFLRLQPRTAGHVAAGGGPVAGAAGS